MVAPFSIIPFFLYIVYMSSSNFQTVAYGVQAFAYCVRSEPPPEYCVPQKGVGVTLIFVHLIFTFCSHYTKIQFTYKKATNTYNKNFIFVTEKCHVYITWAS